MSTGKLIKSPPGLRREWTEGTERYDRTYCDPNPIVRYLNWIKLERLFRWGRHEGAQVALDLGCGTGIFLPTLSSEFRRVVAVDLDVSVAMKVQAYFLLNNLNLIRAHASFAPFRAGVFDIVFAASVLEHFRDLAEILGEIQRILRPGGTLLMVSPSENLFYRIGRAFFGYQKPFDHYHSAGEIIREMRRFFVLEKVKDFPVPFFSSLAVYTFARARKAERK